MYGFSRWHPVDSAGQRTGRVSPLPRRRAGQTARLESATCGCDVQCDGPPERVSPGKPIAAVPAACSWLEFAVSA